MRKNKLKAKVKKRIAKIKADQYDPTGEKFRAVLKIANLILK